jgi:HEAT repeat protein
MLAVTKHFTMLTGLVCLCGTAAAQSQIPPPSGTKPIANSAVTAAANADADIGKAPRLELSLDLPDNEVGRLVRQHLTLTLTGENKNPQTYYTSLRALQRQPEAVSAALTRAYDGLDEGRYFERWGVVQTLGSLRSQAAASALATVALTPLPPENFDVSATDRSSREDEAMIRFRAIDGLAALAADGDTKALENLRQAIKAVDFTVRRAAAQAYLHLKPEARNDVASLLPKNEQFILSLARGEARKDGLLTAPQPTKTKSALNVAP